MKPKPKEKASSRIEQFGLIDWRWLLWNGRRLAGAHEERCWLLWKGDRPVWRVLMCTLLCVRWDNKYTFFPPMSSSIRSDLMWLSWLDRAHGC